MSNTHADTNRPEVIAMLPSNRQHDLLRKGSDFANRMGVAEALEALGFRVEFLDVHAWPLNPLAGRPSLFSSIVSATGSFGLAFVVLGALTAIATVWLVVAEWWETSAGL